MADDVTLNAGAGGDVIAADEVGGVKIQRVKIVEGNDGVNDGDVSSTNPLPVEQPATVDSGNSTTTPLGVSGVFTGTGIDMTQYGSLSVSVYADVASATDGLSIEFSPDGTNWDMKLQHTVTAAHGEHFIEPRMAKYFRVVYTNGGTGQTAFRLQTILNKWSVPAENQHLSVALTGDDPTLTTRAVIAGQTPGGSYTNVQVSNGGNFKVDVEDLGGNAVSVDTGTSDTGTQRVVLADDQPSVTVDAPVATPVNVQISDGTDTALVSAGGRLSVETTGITAVDSPTGAFPVGLGARASTAVPTAVSLDGDVQHLWLTREGAVNVVNRNVSGTETGTATTPLRVDPTGSTAQPVAGTAAHDAAVSGNPVLNGAEARTTNPTAVGDGDAVRVMADDVGRQVVVPHGVRDRTTHNTITLTTSTETTLLAAVAATFLDLVFLSITNTSASPDRVDFRDSTTGTVRLSIYVAAGATHIIPFPVPMKQAAVNNNWTAQCATGVTDIRIAAIAVENV